MSDTISLGFKLTGEADFKRALTDINNSLKLNSSELGLVSAKYAENGKSADALTAKNKILQSSIENEQTKITTLKSAIDSASAAHLSAGTNIGNLKTQLAAATTKMTEMKASTDTTKNELAAQQTIVKGLTKELNTAEKAYTSTGKSTTAWGTELNNSQAKVITMNKQLDENTKSLKKSETGSKSVADAVNGLASAAGINVPPALQGMISKLDGTSASGAALVGVLGGIAVALAKTTIDTAKSADEIDVLAKKTGMSTDKIQELNYSSELLDVSTETIAGSLTKLTKNMNASKSETSSQAKAFKELGVSAVDTHGNLRDANDVFLRTVDALGKVTNETERDALSMTIFGKSAKELNPLIEAGSGKLKDLAKEAHNVGAVMSGGTIDKLNEFKDAMDRVDQQGNALKVSFAGALLPVLTALFETISKIPVPVLNTIMVITGVIATIVLAVKAIREVSAAGGILSSVFGLTINPVMIKTIAIISAVVIALIALAAVIAVLMGRSSEMNSTFNSIGNNVNKMKGQVSTSTKVGNNARGTNYWSGGYTWVGEEGPEIVDLPAGSKVYPNGVIPKMNSISNLPHYALGTSSSSGGSALVGEYGRELVALPGKSNAQSSAAQYTFTGPIIIDAKNVKEFNDILKFAKQASQFKVQGAN